MISQVSGVSERGASSSGDDCFLPYAIILPGHRENGYLIATDFHKGSKQMETMTRGDRSHRLTAQLGNHVRDVLEIKVPPLTNWPLTQPPKDPAT